MFFKRVALLISLLVFFFLFALFPLNRVHAANEITVTVTVEDTSVSFSGYSSPGAIITIIKDGAVISTQTTNSEGYFYKKIGALVPDIYTFSLYSTDKDGNVTPTLEFSLALPEKTNTHLKNIIFPPIIYENVVRTSDSVIISGVSIPFAEIILNVGEVYQSTTCDADGYWEIEVLLTKLKVGQNIVTAIAKIEDNFQSSDSNILGLYIEGSDLVDEGSIPYELFLERLDDIGLVRDSDFSCCDTPVLVRESVRIPWFVYVILAFILLTTLLFFFFRRKKDSEDK